MKISFISSLLQLKIGKLHQHYVFKVLNRYFLSEQPWEKFFKNLVSVFSIQSPKHIHVFSFNPSYNFVKHSYNVFIYLIATPTIEII